MNRIYLACDDSIPRIDGYDPFCDQYLCAQTDENGCVYVTFPYDASCNVVNTSYYVHKNSSGYYVDVPDCCLDTCGCEDIDDLNYYPVLNLSNLEMCKDFTLISCVFFDSDFLATITSDPIAELMTYSAAGENTYCTWSEERSGTKSYNGSNYDWKVISALQVTAILKYEDSTEVCYYSFIISITFWYRLTGAPSWTEIEGGFLYNSGAYKEYCSGPDYLGITPLLTLNGNSPLTCYTHNYSSGNCTPTACSGADCLKIVKGSVDLWWEKA